MSLKPAFVASLCASVATVAIGVTALQLSGDTDSTSAEEIARAAVLDALEERVSATERRYDELRSALESSDARLAEALRELREARQLASAAASDRPRRTAAAASNDSDIGSAEPQSEPADPDAAVTVDESIALLFDPTVPRGRKQQVWAELRKNGHIDRAVEEWEAYAAEDPDDPDRQSQLGDAYIQALFGAGFLERGALSMKANAAYDRALVLDDHHWEARFSKAVNWSFSPPALGLQAKAIDQLEVLLAQQNQAPGSEERFAQTYMLLGNLYSNQGDADKATKVRARGQELYPEAKSWFSENDGAGGETE